MPLTPFCDLGQGQPLGGPWFPHVWSADPFGPLQPEKEPSVSSSPACGIPLSVSSGRTGVLHPERPQMAHHWPTAVIRWGASSPSRLRSLLHKGQVGAKVVFESLWACVPALGKNPEALSKSCDSELPVRPPGQVPHSIGAFRALQS